jgi:hypothetical protein
MVASCQEQKRPHRPFVLLFAAFFYTGIFDSPVHYQRRGHRITTVDQSDMLGLVTG